MFSLTQITHGLTLRKIWTHDHHLFVSALTRRVIQGLNLRLPYTVVLLVLGILFGLLSRKYPIVHVYALIVEADPHLILTIFLPVLLFESAFAMEVHTFIKTFIQVVVLAIPGLGKYFFFNPDNVIRDKVIRFLWQFMRRRLPELPDFPGTEGDPTYAGNYRNLSIFRIPSSYGNIVKEKKGKMQRMSSSPFAMALWLGLVFHLELWM